MLTKTAPTPGFDVTTLRQRGRREMLTSSPPPAQTELWLVCGRLRELARQAERLAYDVISRSAPTSGASSG